MVKGNPICFRVQPAVVSQFAVGDNIKIEVPFRTNAFPHSVAEVRRSDDQCTLTTLLNSFLQELPTDIGLPEAHFISDNDTVPFIKEASCTALTVLLEVCKIDRSIVLLALSFQLITVPLVEDSKIDQVWIVGFKAALIDFSKIVTIRFTLSPEILEPVLNPLGDVRAVVTEVEFEVLIEPRSSEVR